MRYMRRVPVLCEDEGKILEAINAFLPLTSHTSRWIRGGFWKIGRMNVASKLLQSICERHGITLAEHFRLSIRYSGRDKIYGWHKKKSRFGETTVEYYLTGGVRYTDNELARAFYDEQAKAATNAIVDTLHSEGKAAAIAIKKQLQKEGRA